MAYYIRDSLHERSALGARRPTINEFFLSSYTLSIYNGCEFGCPYCDSWLFSDRPLNETIRVPLDLPECLATELTQVDRGDLIALSTLSDPYQPAEQIYRLTRRSLQVLADRGQPTLVLTKSPDVLEDIAILQRIHEQSLAIVMTTLLTTDPRLASQLEGKAPQPALRLEMLSELKRAGIPVGVAIVPIMPYVNDTDSMLRNLLRACADIAVDFVIWDYLHISNRRHRMRINEIITRLNTYPASYYDDIYGNQPVVSALYRQERNKKIVSRCDGLGLEVRAPHHLFAQRLAPNNEAALFLKHMAFRDRVNGRDKIALLHQQLADQIYQGSIDVQTLRQSPFHPTVGPILGLS